MNRNALDLHTTTSVDSEELKAVLSCDLGCSVPQNHESLGGPRCHLGLLIMYVGVPPMGHSFKPFREFSLHFERDDRMEISRGRGQAGDRPQSLCRGF